MNLKNGSEEKPKKSRTLPNCGWSDDSSSPDKLFREEQFAKGVNHIYDYDPEDVVTVVMQVPMKVKNWMKILRGCNANANYYTSTPGSLIGEILDNGRALEHWEECGYPVRVPTPLTRMSNQKGGAE